jgi:hypothetical protein
MDDFNITICSFSWREKKDDFTRFVNSLSDNKKSMFLSVDDFKCISCRETCDVGTKIMYQDKEHILCSRSSYVCENPTSDQLEMIEWLINVGRNYIDFKKTNKQSGIKSRG